MVLWDRASPTTQNTLGTLPCRIENAAGNGHDVGLTVELAKNGLHRATEVKDIRSSVCPFSDIPDRIMP